MKNRKTDSSAKLAAPHLSLQWTHRDDIDLLMWLCKATNKSSCSVNKSHLIGETYKKQWNNTLIWYVRMPLPALLSAPFLLTPRLHSSLWEFFSPSFCLLLTLTLFQTLRELPDEPLCNTNAEITFWMINVCVMSCLFFVAFWIKLHPFFHHKWLILPFWSDEIKSGVKLPLWLHTVHTFSLLNDRL